MLAALAALAAFSSLHGSAPPDVDAAFAKFWAAKDPGAAGKAVNEILRSGATFDAAYERLKRGRPYHATVATGVVTGRRIAIEGEFAYTLDVPASYDPARPIGVRIQLHGGVNRASPPAGRGGIGRLAGTEQIYIIPSAWNEAPWWSDAQVENLRAILDTVKRTYNVDENRVVISGVSDGGTGAFYVAMRDTTPYAAFLPLNGAIIVLRNPEIATRADLFPNNLRNKPFFVVNGGRDPLYPAGIVDPYLEHLRRGGVSIDYRPQPEAGHNTAWWPQLREPFETFVREHPRVPLPDRLTWESSGPRTRGRAHWLSIDGVGSVPSDAVLPDINDMLVATADTIKPSAPAAAQKMTLFEHSRRAGRVDLVRSGNTIEAVTRNVTELTLLLSPDQFDFDQPVKVTVNGRTAFDGRVEKSLATLMKWAARDNDRTMLFAAEVKVKPAR